MLHDRAGVLRHGAPVYRGAGKVYLDAGTEHREVVTELRGASAVFRDAVVEHRGDVAVLCHAVPKLRETVPELRGTAAERAEEATTRWPRAEAGAQWQSMLDLFTDHPLRPTSAAQRLHFASGLRSGPR